MELFLKDRWTRNRPLKSGSISRRLTAGLTATVVVVAAIAIASIYFHAVFKEKKELQEKGDEILAYLMGTLEIPLWNFDERTIRVIGESVSQNELIVKLNIAAVGNDPHARVFYAMEKEHESDVITRSAKVRHNGHVIGKIELSLTKRFYRENRQDLLVSFFLITVVILITLILVTEFFIHLFLKKPLNSLNRVVNSYAAGNYDPPDETVDCEEFRSLEKVLAGMGGKIKGQLEELQKTEEKYRSLFEDSPVSIWEEDFSLVKGYFDDLIRSGVTDFRSFFHGNPDAAGHCAGLVRVLDVNQVTLSLLGARSKEELMAGLPAIFTEASMKVFTEELIILAEGGRRFEREIVQQALTGEEKTVVLQLSVAPGYEETLGKVFVSMLDITERKRTEEEKTLLEAQLQQAQKMEALGNLAGGVAHDFNNLLQAMSGYVQLLLMKKQPDDPDYKYLSEIEKATARAKNLVTRLLTFSRRMEFDFRPIFLNGIVRSAVKLLERTIPKMVAIKTVLDPDLAVIQGDANQMEQVLMNLANNAVDAMGGSGRLIIETRNFTVDEAYKNRYLELEPGEYVLIRVSDTGEGMDEKTLKRIFEPFFTTKALGKGTGLGLATVYGIVKGHKGDIGCYSEPGKGTTFKIFLPAAEAAQEFTAGDGKEVTLTRKGTETILIADDEEVIQEIGEELLTQYGYTVYKASSGEAALAFYKENASETDLVLLDLGMPGMGGEKCLQALLEMDPDVKVLVASGYAAHKIAKDPQRYGAGGFISKPYKLDELLLKVRAVLDA